MAQATSDLAHARADIERAFYDWACFSAQQAAEKAVKALLNRLGADVWGHSVAGFLEKLPQGPAKESNLMAGAAELDKAYIPTRYPDAFPSGSPSTQYTLREAERLVGYATEVVEYCQGRLSALDS